MPVYREVLRLHYEFGKSYALTAELTGLSTGGVHNILQRFQASGLPWPLPTDLTDVALHRRLYPAQERFPSAALDTEDLRMECARPGVTRQLLWEEYRARHPTGISRSAFYRLCQQVEQKAPVMKTVYQGGEYLFVDYSGQGLCYTDRATATIIPVEIFVASWGASSFTYVEAGLTQSAHDFAYAHVRAFAYFNCLPRVVTPDNLKAAITKADRADPELCQLYRKFAEHYDLVILPARVAHPRDKATAEVAVRCVQQRVLAPLRQQTFFSLAEINDAIAPLRDALNDRPMKAYGGRSRRERFHQYDVPQAPPLPVEPFQVTAAQYAIRVPTSYLITYEDHGYSVPHSLIDHHVDLFLVGDVLEIYHHGQHVVRHAKAPADGLQSIVEAHMPEPHRRVRQRSKADFLHVAAFIGPYTVAVVEALYVRMKHDEQAHRAAQGLINLCKRYDSERVEAAAARAVYFRRPFLRDIKQILLQGLDQQPLPGAGQNVLPFVPHANLRGATYYQEGS